MSDHDGKTLLAGMRRKAEEEAAAILREAEEAAAARRRSFEAWKERERAEWQKKEEAEMLKGDERLESRVRMERKKIGLQAREQLIEELESRAMHRMEELSTGEDYPKVLAGWILEGALALGENSIILRGTTWELDIMNDDFLKGVSRRYHSITGSDVAFTADASRPGAVPGILLESADGRISYDNRIPARFSRLKTHIRRIIYRALTDAALEDESK